MSKRTRRPAARGPWVTGRADDRRGEFWDRAPAGSDLVRSGQLFQKATAKRSACGGTSGRVQGHGGMVKAGRRERPPRQTPVAGHRRARPTGGSPRRLCCWHTAGHAGPPPVAVAAARGSTGTPLTTASGERRPGSGGRSTRCVALVRPRVTD